tara:strand:- start:1299 stop:2666 length:1368 start_codon:yes stop_codon:yes gene_type:complete
MSIQKRRNSLFKSSISIRSIGDALQSFSDGLVAARRNSDKSIKTIRQRNIFKRNSIRNDNKYFRQRQENIKRKAREDELEASSVQGVPKTQGNILTKSTRGFLGRMLDFIGILIIGWAITNLPKIINAIQGLIKRISSVTGILSLFVDGIKFVLTGIGTVIKGAISNLLRFDFLKTKTDVEQGLEGANTGIFQARSELELAGQQFADSETFGLPDPPAFETDKPQRVRDSENNEEKKAVLQNEGTEAEVEQKSKNIDKIIETGLGETDDQVVEGDADDVEGVSNDLNSFLQESEGGTTGGSSSSSSSGGTTVVDPRDELKNKQKEALNTNNQRRRNRRGRRTSSSFLETPSSVENIKESVTPNNLDTGSNRGELVASVEITDEMKAQALSPVKKEVNIPSNRKSKNKIIIVEKQSGNGNQSITMPSNGSSKTIVKAVDDEKLLMKMQSTSTLKYT